MRTTSVIVGLLSYFFVGVLCQTNPLQQLPSCAEKCMQQTINVTPCASTDITCLCSDAQFLAAASACQATTCTVKEVLTATNATLAACGVPTKDQSATVYGIAGSFGSVAILMTVLRIVDRVFINEISLGWDDAFILCATTLALPVNYLCIAAAYYGLGRDMWSLTFPDIDMTFKLVYCAEIFYMASEMFVQLSLLAFLLRVFSDRTFKHSIYVLMSIVIGFGIANTFVMIFPNNPVPFFWKGWAGEMQGTGINMNLYCWIRAAFEIAIDLTIIILPLPHLWKLQMSMQKKAQVLAMFCIGFVITIVSALRLRSLIQYSKTQNPTYDNTAAIYWSVLENDMFIICACMPAMRPVLKKLSPSCFGSSRDGRSNTRYTASQDFGPNAKYVRYDSKRGHSGKGSEGSVTAKITKAVDVVSYRTERSDSDIELMKPAVSGKIYGA